NEDQCDGPGLRRALIRAILCDQAFLQHPLFDLAAAALEAGVVDAARSMIRLQFGQLLTQYADHHFGLCALGRVSAPTRATTEQRRHDEQQCRDHEQGGQEDEFDHLRDSGGDSLSCSPSSWRAWVRWSAVSSGVPDSTARRRRRRLSQPMPRMASAPGPSHNSIVLARNGGLYSTKSP